MSEYKQVLKAFDKVKSKRSNWNNMYQVIGRYVHMNKQNFTTQPSSGEFLINEIFDTTAVFAAHNAASIILGMVWTGAASQVFEIVPPEDIGEVTTELAKYYEKLNKITYAAFDDPKANLKMSLDEYMLEQMCFGTSALSVEAGRKSKLLFKAHGVKELYLCDNDERLYLELEMDVDRVVSYYGLENVSQRLREKYLSEDYSHKVKVVIAIRPRSLKTAEIGKYAMEFQGLHLEYNGGHLLREDGYEEFPVHVGHFRKLAYEEYGRSPSMNALPDIMEANALREAVIVATEKHLNPPLGMLHDGILGGGIVNRSAGDLTVFNAAAAMGNSKPIFNVDEVGDLVPALKRLEQINEVIAQHYFIDRLLDFNNDTTMTFGEAQIREQRSNASMDSIYQRQYSVVQAMTERAISILFRAGEYGVIRGSQEEAEAAIFGREIEYIPDVLAERVVKQKDFYRLIFKTKAANASRAEQYVSIVDMVNFVLNAMQVDPNLKHKLDLPEAIDLLANIRGIPEGVLRKKDEVSKRVAAEQQMIEAQQALQAGEQIANIADKSASAQQRQEQRA